MDAKLVEEIAQKFSREYYKGRIAWIEGVDHSVVVDSIEVGTAPAPPPPPPKPAAATPAAAGAQPAAPAAPPAPPPAPAAAAPAAPTTVPAIVVKYKLHRPKDPMHVLPRGAPGGVTLPKTYEKVAVTFKAA